MDHMALVNKLRNSQAAHSGIQTLDVRSSAASKAELAKDGQDVVRGFLHMLSHFEKVEVAMMVDLADKGAIIEQLGREGMSADETKLKLEPGKPLVQPVRSS